MKIEAIRLFLLIFALVGIVLAVIYLLKSNHSTESFSNYLFDKCDVYYTSSPAMAKKCDDGAFNEHPLAYKVMLQNGGTPNQFGDWTETLKEYDNFPDGKTCKLSIPGWSKYYTDENQQQPVFNPSQTSATGAPKNWAMCVRDVMDPDFPMDEVSIETNDNVSFDKGTMSLNKGAYYRATLNTFDLKSILPFRCYAPDIASLTNPTPAFKGLVLVLDDTNIGTIKSFEYVINGQSVSKDLLNGLSLFGSMFIQVENIENGNRVLYLQPQPSVLLNISKRVYDVCGTYTEPSSTSIALEFTKAPVLKTIPDNASNKQLFGTTADLLKENADLLTKSSSLVAQMSALQQTLGDQQQLLGTDTAKLAGYKADIDTYNSQLQDANDALRKLKSFIVTFCSGSDFKDPVVAIPINTEGTFASSAVGKISSIQNPSGITVVLYSGAGFVGESIVITADTPNLMSLGWNNRAMSYRVLTAGAPWDPPAYVIFFSDCAFGNAYYNYSQGSSGNFKSDFTDNLSSIENKNNLTVVLFSGANYTGDVFVSTTDVPCLKDQNFDKIAKSYMVLPANQQWGYTQGGTPVKALDSTDYGSWGKYQNSYGAGWIWYTDNFKTSAPINENITFQKVLYCDDTKGGHTVQLRCTCDDTINWIKLNGAQVSGSYSDWSNMQQLNINLAYGANLLEFNCVNTSGAAGLWFAVLDNGQPIAVSNGTVQWIGLTWSTRGAGESDQNWAIRIWAALAGEVATATWIPGGVAVVQPLLNGVQSIDLSQLATACTEAFKFPYLAPAATAFGCAPPPPPAPPVTWNNRISGESDQDWAVRIWATLAGEVATATWMPGGVAVVQPLLGGLASVDISKLSNACTEAFKWPSLIAHATGFGCTLPEAPRPKYIGCFADKGGRPIPNGQVQHQTMDQCNALARQAGSLYFGMQNWPGQGDGNTVGTHGECWYGDYRLTLDTATRDGVSTNCDKNPTDNYTYGGSGTNAVYSTLPDPITQDYDVATIYVVSRTGDFITWRNNTPNEHNVSTEQAVMDYINAKMSQIINSPRVQTYIAALTDQNVTYGKITHDFITQQAKTGGENLFLY